MALATKCPHCNTVFRVAHDQLKLRGGIVRCGACNEVFDGNAALLEPAAALPPTIPFDQKMAALDNRAAEVLSIDDAEPVLELDDVLDEAVSVSVPEPAPGPLDAAPDLPLPPAPAPIDNSALFDLDLDIESEPDLEASSEPEVRTAPLEDILNADAMSDDDLEAALEAELSAMELTLADVPHDADGLPASEDAYADMSGGRIEPTWGEPPLDDEPQAGAGPRLGTAFAAAADAVFSAEQDDAELEREAEPAPAPTTAHPLRDDELDAVDEEALVQLSTGGLSQVQAERAHAYLHAESADDATEEAYEEHAAPEEPGFVKRDRLRRKYGKATTIAMSLGSVLLVAALLAQAVTTFRNALAANVPALKPALTAACKTLGCKIELPTQIDDLTIEQGELQTLSDTTFSFTTLLRNQSGSAQAWPSIELMLDDANDKRILRRVFTPRDYLSADVALDKGFTPHSEQAVKLYFELHDLKASGYHIAVFYP
ncbi:DUF3426 domain-containing protein [Duganella sp. BuS-21]|uniref:DUF3426 domain-containing protein n=1 Tax=Duganella sp. BuS-21 TaxID=2943848 RepID=UPI0035A5773C